MNYLSFLVDDLPLHYYQSELLLFSLEKFTSFNKNNILIHCTTRVNKDFLLFLKEQDYNYKIVEPYLDGKYCNKLQQLSSFKELNDEDAVFLVDADTFFLNDPIVNYSSKVGGKVVDAPNPPLRVLTKIFNEAKLSYPKIVPTDWIMKDAYTFECNFNGGFYYVPAKELPKVNELWRKWATWLYGRLELFETKAQRIHVDQVSFSMMLAESKFDYQVLISNNNCPIHRSTKQRLFDDTKEVSMLHYHRSLNSFGLLNTSLAINPIVDKAIEKINSTISEKKDFQFFKQFNKSFVKLTKSTEKTKVFEDKISNLVSKFTAKKIILHAGTPKTGTTSLQFFLDEKHDELLSQGVLYPKYYLDINPPKHQWLVKLLKENNFDGIFSYLERILNEAKDKDVKNIFLSTEGIYNHWWDFSNEAKEVLRLISKYFNFELYIVFREPSSFLESFYKQNLKNPQNNAAKCYGKDMSFEEMLKDEWFIKHIDYLAFVQECEVLFGKKHIKVFTYSNDVNLMILKELNVVLSENKEERRANIGQSYIGVELLKVVNRFNLNAKDKKHIVKTLKQMDEVFDNYLATPLLNEDNYTSVKKLFSLQSNILSSEYKLSFRNRNE